MKTTTIELTKAQIELLIKADKEVLLSNKTKAIDLLEKNYESELAKLEGKYKTITVNIGDGTTIKERKPRSKVNAEQIKQLLAEGKKVAEIAKQTGVSIQSIRKFK